jgi:hypothetical protein
MWTAPGGGVAGTHVHRRSEERFDVLSGRLVLDAGGRRRVLLAGDHSSVPAGVPHRWHNGGEDELHMIVELDRPGRFEDMIAAAFAAGRDGGFDSLGRMRTLPAAALVRRFPDEIAPPWPAWLQRLVIPPLALIARGSGRMRAAMALLVVVAALLSVAGGTASAAQAPAVGQQQRFRVEVKGVQKTVWRSWDDEGGRCEPASSSNGFETNRFRTRPIVLTATPFGPSVLMLGTTRARGRVTRQAHFDDVRVPDDCAVAGGGGGEAPPTPAPDCGTRNGKFLLQVKYEHERVHPGFTITGAAGASPFTHCATAGTSFPGLVAYTTKGRLIMAELRPRDLLDRRIGKHIVVASGTYRQDGDYGLSHHRIAVSIRWEISLRRVK